MSSLEQTVRPLNVYLEGGGIAAGVTAGMLLALFEGDPDLLNLKDMTFSATSGSTGTIFYALANIDNKEEMSHSIRNIWTQEIADSQFVQAQNIFTKRPIMDIEYLTEVILKKQNPFDVRKLRNLSIGYALPVYDVEARKTVWLVNQQGEKSLPDNQEYINVEGEDPYVVLRATKSVPFLDNRTVMIRDRLLLDGVIDYPFPVIQDDDSVGILLLAHPRRVTMMQACTTWCATIVSYVFQYVYKQNKLPAHIYTKFASRAFRHRELMEYVEREERQGRIIVIEPAVDPGFVADNSNKALISNFELGYQAGQDKLEDIHTFLRQNKVL